MRAVVAQTFVLLLFMAAPVSRAASQDLASPSDVSLGSLVREEKMISAVGRIELRWPRSAEVLFGRTPQRAMAEAAHAVNRALHQAGFSPALQNLSLDWKVVFMDASLPETQIPAYLINNCHPGWMTPPANIYIVAQRVTSGCGGGRNAASRVGDALLAQVLIHEMGHAVEYQLLKSSNAPHDRMRAEGFATWFEQYASEFSNVIPRGQVAQARTADAKAALQQFSTGYAFTGTPLDYARASLYFTAVVNRRGVSGLMDVYRSMQAENKSLIDAIKNRFSWSDKQLEKELARAAGID